MRALVAAPSNGNDYGARGSRSPSHHSCDVRYLASVPVVQGGSGIRRELRWPVKYDQSHWRCTRRRFATLKWDPVELEQAAARLAYVH